MHSKNDNIKIMTSIEADDVTKELVDSLKIDIQIICNQ